MSVAPQYQAIAYAHNRPGYPGELYENLKAYAQPAGPGNAVDLGAGSGQAARELADHGYTVTACDSSESQLQQALPASNVRYRCCSAESTGLPEASADLVTAASAFHWFDQTAATAEARRLLKPGGVLALWTYNRACVVEPAVAAVAFDQAILQALAAYWDPRIKLAEDQYTGLQLPHDTFHDVRRQHFQLKKQMTVQQMAGLVQSWSGYAAYEKANPGGPDVVQLWKDQLKPVLGANGTEPMLTVHTKLCLVMARAK